VVNKELLGQAQLVLEVNKEQSALEVNKVPKDLGELLELLVLEVNKEQLALEVNKVLKEVGVLLELQE
jgi:hypothetical protein